MTPTLPPEESPKRRRLTPPEAQFLVFASLVIFLTIGALVWAVQNAPLFGVVALLVQVIGIGLAASWHRGWRFRSYEEQMRALGLEDPDGASLLAFGSWQAMERDGILPSPHQFGLSVDLLQGAWGRIRSTTSTRVLLWFLPTMTIAMQICNVYVLVSMICFGDDPEGRVEELQEWRRRNPGRRWPWDPVEQAPAAAPQTAGGSGDGPGEG